MPAIDLPLLPRQFDPSQSASEFLQQWTHPSDVLSVLLILGGDVVERALAQLAGSRVTPIAFSFGWVAYAVSAMVSAIGENRLMPLPDTPCKVINGSSGNVRDNSSWILGRLVRDFATWKSPEARKEVDRMISERWDKDKERARKDDVPRPTQAGLCVSIYSARPARPGHPGYDAVYFIGFFTFAVQLGIATIPCAFSYDWGILTITAAGITLSFATGSLPQWAREKWACRSRSKKDVILTQGNGSQHAIVILGNGVGFDLEDLAGVRASAGASTAAASYTTRLVMTALALLWILLLISAAGMKQNTLYLLVIGAIGILQNIFVAGWRREPEAYGIPLKFEGVIAKSKVMDTLFALEDDHPRLGRSMLSTYFPSRLRPDEESRWREADEKADQLDVDKKENRKKPVEAEMMMLTASTTGADVLRQDSGISMESTELTTS